MKRTTHNKGYIRVKVNGEWVLEHRYVMEQRLGRKLQADEIVHHKDGNKKNNADENLELHSRQSHGKLHSDEQKPAEIWELICPHCKKSFFRPARKVRYAQKISQATYCSRSCSGKASIDKSKISKLSMSDICEIKRLLKEGVSQSAIARQFGVSRGMIWHIKEGRSHT